MQVQRPGVLETVTVDLYIIRTLGLFLRRFPAITRVRWACCGLPTLHPAQCLHSWAGVV